MSELNIQSITPNIGAEIRGVDVSTLGDSDIAQLRERLIERKVLVFRDQDISSRDYVDFVGHFGEPIQDDLIPHEGHPPELGILHIQPKERQTINFWHMDYSFREKPAPLLSLCAKQLPACGGDTLFTNLEAAYDALPDETKAQIHGLEANHKVIETQNSAKRFSQEEFKAMVEGDPIRHPLVCVNPQNGRNYLFVNVPIYCRSIADMENPKGDALLQSLYLHAQRPEFHFRLKWEVNTLIVWENTHCLHYPVADYYPLERKLWRVATRAVEKPMAA